MAEKEKQHEHILACLSSAPSNARIVRTAARMARAFDCPMTALFVQTPDFAAASSEDKQRLRANQQLAMELGATVETTYGDDVPSLIAEYARLSGVTKIVLGRSAAARKRFFGKPPLTELLLAYAPDIDIHIIPDTRARAAYRPRSASEMSPRSLLCNAAKSAAILAGATVLCALFERLGFSDANLIMVYILGVVLTSMVTTHRAYALASAVISVIAFNFLFTTPRFSFTAYETGYPVTFLVMFLTTYITATLAVRYKEQAGQSARIAHRTRVLFDTDQLLSKAAGRDEIHTAAGSQIVKLLGRAALIFPWQDGQFTQALAFAAPDQPMPAYGAATESANAHASLKSDAAQTGVFLYFPIRMGDHLYGAVGIHQGANPPDASEQSMLRSILAACALALENDHNDRAKKAAAVLAESEQLRANLLRSISHDLRTPLTTISGNASSLLHNGDGFDDATRKRLYADIYEDSMYLVGLVENLLSATRIEEGRLTLRTSIELLGDIAEEAAAHVAPKAGEHSLSVVQEDELLLVRADAHLITQVIVNLIENAVKYTPPGSSIRVTLRRDGAHAAVEVADDGPGVPDSDKPRIFEKFYTGEHRVADNRRSMGLGLYLCKAIIKAHGGEIAVRDNTPRGAVFAFTLPLDPALADAALSAEGGLSRE